MIRGTVTQDGEPTIYLQIGGKKWPAIIDTGFNGDLELPESLFDNFDTVYGVIQSLFWRVAM